ncbi:MAG: GNAT family N-acetyltransferase [Gammaproteobacteria bacterium]|nr:GNAT family N-acetyltransferase [Gammaproteobacteria bacterium]
MIATRILSAADTGAFQNLTYPAYRARLADDGICAVGALDNDIPVGLALAVPQDAETMELLSLFTLPKHRGRGIAGKLLTALEQRLREAGIKQLHCVYTEKPDTTEAVERLIEKHGWNAPRPRMLLCKSNYSLIKQAPWWNRFTLPAEYQLFPWADVNKAEARDVVKRQQKEHWVPDLLMPSEDDDPYAANSLAMRHENKIVGWCLCHQMNTVKVRYTKLFVHRDLQRRLLMLPMLCAAIEKQVELVGEFAQATWTTPFELQGMITFIKRRMRPYLLSADRTMGTGKQL